MLHKDHKIRKEKQTNMTLEAIQTPLIKQQYHLPRMTNSMARAKLPQILVWIFKWERRARWVLEKSHICKNVFTFVIQIGSECCKKAQIFLWGQWEI